jgi:hypothetical protein
VGLDCTRRSIVCITWREVIAPLSSIVWSASRTRFVACLFIFLALRVEKGLDVGVLGFFIGKGLYVDVLGFYIGKGLYVDVLGFFII